jgi:hypothetical protein
MPLYMIERRYAEQIDPGVEEVTFIQEANADVGVSWVFSFLAADRRRSYCLYEAPSPDALREAARRAKLPADVIVEIGRRVVPEEVLAAAGSS